MPSTFLTQLRDEAVQLRSEAVNGPVVLAQARSLVAAEEEQGRAILNRGTVAASAAGIGVTVVATVAPALLNTRIDWSWHIGVITLPVVSAHVGDVTLPVGFILVILVVVVAAGALLSGFLKLLDLLALRDEPSGGASAAERIQVSRSEVKERPGDLIDRQLLAMAVHAENIRTRNQERLRLLRGMVRRGGVGIGLLVALVAAVASFAPESPATVRFEGVQAVSVRGTPSVFIHPLPVPITSKKLAAKH